MSADIQLLVEKIMTDEEFAKTLAENPETTLKEAGIEPTIDLLQALQGVDAASLKKLAATFDEEQAAL